MKLYSLFLSHPLRWNIEQTDPATWLALDDLGTVILNPFVSLENEPLPSSFPIREGKFHVLTNRLYLATQTPMQADALDRTIQPWLRLLRVASKQASLPTEVYGFSEQDFDLADIQTSPPAARPRGTLFGEFHIRTALDGAALQRAHQMRNEAAAPLFNELLLDALQACEARRNREAILYAAIAVEALAQHQLTKAYQEALNAATSPAHMNILSFSQAGGTVKKDPIFTLLTEADNFGRLLHEAPLYLMRRSLLSEIPDLYRRARSLYSTRNRLGHGQAVTPGNENLLQVDATGAAAAVQIAVEVFAWFGQTGYFTPDRRAIEIEA